MLQALDAEPVLLHIKVLDTQQPDFGGAQPVTVGEKEERSVTFGIDGRQEIAHFALGEKLDGSRAPRLAGRCAYLHLRFGLFGWSLGWGVHGSHFNPCEHFWECGR